MNIKSRNNDILMREESLAVIRHLVELSPAATRVLFLLMRQMDKTGLSWALPRHIAKEVGLGEQSVRTALKCLRKRKFTWYEIPQCVFINSAIAWKGKVKDIESAPFYDPSVLVIPPSVLSLNQPTPEAGP